VGSGRAFTWIISEKFRGRAPINLLEFLTQVIQIWVDIIEKRIQPEDCILAIGDNISSMGWLKRTNFRESTDGDKENDNDRFVKQQVARKFAEMIPDAKACLY